DICRACSVRTSQTRRVICRARTRIFRGRLVGVLGVFHPVYEPSLDQVSKTLQLFATKTEFKPAPAGGRSIIVRPWRSGSPPPGLKPCWIPLMSKESTSVSSRSSPARESVEPSISSRVHPPADGGVTGLGGSGDGMPAYWLGPVRAAMPKRLIGW